MTALCTHANASRPIGGTLFGASPVKHPVTFVQLVGTTLSGVPVLGKAVDPFVILGGSILMAAITAAFRRGAVFPSVAAVET